MPDATLDYRNDDKHAHVISSNALSREGLARIISDGGFSVRSATAEIDQIDWSECGDDDLFVLDCSDRKEQVDWLERIIEKHPAARCVVLSDTFAVDQMMSCFGRKASGYLVKNMPCSPLIASLQLASTGQRVMPSDLIDALSDRSTRLLDRSCDGPALEKANLSRREIDVLTCVMAGCPNKVIARQLDLSEATVKVHVKAILRKLKVSNRTQAALWGNTQSLAPANVESASF